MILWLLQQSINNYCSTFDYYYQCTFWISWKRTFTGANVKMVLSLKLWVFLIVQGLWSADQYTDEVQHKFAKMDIYTTILQCNAVQWLCSKFHETGSVVSMPWSSRLAVVTQHIGLHSAKPEKVCP